MGHNAKALPPGPYSDGRAAGEEGHDGDSWQQVLKERFLPLGCEHLRGRSWSFKGVDSLGTNIIRPAFRDLLGSSSAANSPLFLFPFLFPLLEAVA